MLILCMLSLAYFFLLKIVKLARVYRRQVYTRLRATKGGDGRETGRTQSLSSSQSVSDASLYHLGSHSLSLATGTDTEANRKREQEMGLHGKEGEEKEEEEEAGDEQLRRPHAGAAGTTTLQSPSLPSLEASPEGQIPFGPVVVAAGRTTTSTAAVSDQVVVVSASRRRSSQLKQSGAPDQVLQGSGVVRGKEQHEGFEMEEVASREGTGHVGESSLPRRGSRTSNAFLLKQMEVLASEREVRKIPESDEDDL